LTLTLTQAAFLAYSTVPLLQKPLLYGGIGCGSMLLMFFVFFIEQGLLVPVVFDPTKQLE
jgi:hypothetical protein